MLWMAIDSSAGTSVALLRAGDERSAGAEVLALAEDRSPRAHAEAVGPLLLAVLAQAAVPASAVDAVAVGVGPGPFTGLRVGIAAAIAFALPGNLPLRGIPSHDAVAARSVARGSELPLTVCRDARRHEWFLTEYVSLDEAGMPRSSDPARVVPQADPLPEHVCQEPPEAEWIGRVAAARSAAGLAPRGVEPIYVRSPDISRAVPKSVLQ